MTVADGTLVEVVGEPSIHEEEADSEVGPDVVLPDLQMPGGAP